MNFKDLWYLFMGCGTKRDSRDYHRLDISATLKPKRKTSKTFQSEWVFSVYNVYNRKNAASINFRQNQDTGRNEAIRTSIFGIIPAITYNFKFNDSMKKFIPTLFLLLTVFSCEDVVQIDTPEEEPRLIVEALIRLDPAEELYRPTVKVSLTSSFFGTIPVTGLRNITITNLGLSAVGGANAIILEETSEGSGLYQDRDPVGLRFFVGGELLLQLEHEGRLYFARTHYVPTVPIDNLSQGDETLFDEDDIELEITITDNGDNNDFTL